MATQSRVAVQIDGRWQGFPFIPSAREVEKKTASRVLVPRVSELTWSPPVAAIKSCPFKVENC